MLACPRGRIGYPGVKGVIVYRAHLPEAPASVLAIRVRPCGRAPQWRFGSHRSMTPWRLVLRYVIAGGQIRTHRGWLHVDLPPDRQVRVSSYHIAGTEVLVALSPVTRSRRMPPRWVEDRFALPLALQAWAVVGVQAAAVSVQARASVRSDALLIRGAVTVHLRTPAAVLKLRVPFSRLVGERQAEGLVWRTHGGVTGLEIRVAPGGLIRGRLTLGLCYEGRPAGAADTDETIGGVRDLTGAVTAVKAESAGDGLILVQGTAEVDAYWVDREHRSRWTGRTVPFSGTGCLSGIQAEDRLEARASVERVRLLSDVQALLLITATVTQIRPVQVRLGDGCYRLEEVLGRTTVTMERPLALADPVIRVRTLPGSAGVMPTLRTPDLWRELRVVLGTRTVPGERWQVRGSLDATPVEEPPGGASGWRRSGVLEGGLWTRPPGAVGDAPGPVAALTGLAVASLSRVGPDGAAVRVRLATERPGHGGGAAPDSGGHRAFGLVAGEGHVGTSRTTGGTSAGNRGKAHRTWDGQHDLSKAAALDLPGPVRWIVDLEVFGGGKPWVRAAVIGEGGMRLVEGPLDEQAWATPPAALTAYPIAEAGRWRLAVEWTPGRGG